MHSPLRPMIEALNKVQRVFEIRVFPENFVVLSEGGNGLEATFLVRIRERAFMEFLLLSSRRSYIKLNVREIQPHLKDK